MAASVSGLASLVAGTSWSKDRPPSAKVAASLGRVSRDRATRTHSRAVRWAMPRRATSQSAMEVAPSSRQSSRRSHSATTWSSWLWATVTRACSWSMASARSASVLASSAPASMSTDCTERVYYSTRVVEGCCCTRTPALSGAPAWRIVPVLRNPVRCANPTTSWLRPSRT